MIVSNPLFSQENNKTAECRALGLHLLVPLVRSNCIQLKFIYGNDKHLYQQSFLFFLLLEIAVHVWQWSEKNCTGGFVSKGTTSACFQIPADCTSICRITQKKLSGNLCQFFHKLGHKFQQLRRVSRCKVADM